MSVVWLSVFVLLCVELIVTAVLVLPLPRLVRKSIASAIFRFELAKRVRFFIRFTILACLFAIWDCVQVRFFFFVVVWRCLLCHYSVMWWCPGCVALRAPVNSVVTLSAILLVAATRGCCSR